MDIWGIFLEKNSGVEDAIETQIEKLSSEEGVLAEMIGFLVGENVFQFNWAQVIDVDDPVFTYNVETPAVVEDSDGADGLVNLVQIYHSNHVRVLRSFRTPVHFELDELPVMEFPLQHALTIAAAGHMACQVASQMYQ